MNDKIIIYILIGVVFILSGSWYRDRSDLENKARTYKHSIDEFRKLEQEARERADKLESELREVKDTINKSQAILNDTTGTVKAIYTNINEAKRANEQGRLIIDELRRELQ
jgi:uncharacterized coiled-coil DUF342 family protein